MRLEGVLAQFADLDLQELTLWMEEGWINAGPDEGADFEASDVARIRLIYDLRRSCGVESQVVPMILALLDQVYDLRYALRSICSAVESQPASVCRDIANIFEEYRRVLPPGGSLPRYQD